MVYLLFKYILIFYNFTEAKTFVYEKDTFYPNGIVFLPKHFCSETEFYVPRQRGIGFL